MMAAVLVALLSLGSVARVFAQEATGRPFITKWRGKAGRELKIPIVGTGYKIVIKNEKGEVVKSEEKVTVTGNGEAYYHAFTPTADGVYTVEAGPAGVRYMQMHIDESHPLTSNGNLLEVVQFGTVAWEKMYRMFYRCENMTFAANIDTPDLTKVTNMESMFRGCSAFNQPLEKWDVSKVTWMDWMFYGCSSFNQPLEEWDVSKVTDMTGMFAGCSAFNQPLEKWNVSKVTKMYAMFYGCSSFNQPLEKWDVSKVTWMSKMFQNCSSFNQPLGAWKLRCKIGGLSTTAMSAVNYSLSLIGWAKQTDGASNISFREDEDVKGRIYNDAGKEAREKLIARGWTFEGDVYRPSEKVAITLDAESEGRLAIEGYDDAALQAVAVCTELTVRATPKEGYTLTSLMAGTQDILATKKFTVTEAVTVKAVFKTIEEAPKGAITLAEEGEGTIEIEGYDKEALQAVAVGTELKVSATPKEGYTLTSLMAGSLDIFATKKFTVTGAMTVKAVFKKKGAITLVKEGEGTLAIEGYNDETLQAVAEGTELTVTATPKDGYSLTSLSAGTQDILATKKFVVTRAITVKAIFKKKVAITLVKEGEGTLAIDGYDATALNAVAMGTELTVIATPADGYSLTSLMVGTIDILTTKKFTVAETVEVKAVFTKNAVTPKDFKVTLIQPEHGTLAIKDHTSETLNAVAENTELEVIDTPEDATYELKELKANGVDIRATKKFAVTTATTVTAVFGKKEETPDPQLKTFKVTLTQPEHGTLAIKDHTAEALNAVAENTELEVIDTPEDATYELKELKANGVDILATKKFTVTGAVTVKAVFKKKGNNGGGNNGGGNGGGGWRPQTPQAVEDAVLASVVVAPNPFTAQLRIENPEGIAVRYELVTLTGNVVRAGVLEGTETIVDTESLPAGLYFARFRTADSSERSVKAIKY